MKKIDEEMQFNFQFHNQSSHQNGREIHAIEAIESMPLKLNPVNPNLKLKQSRWR